MEKKYIITILLIIVILGIYMYFSYSHIYNEVSEKGLKSPDKNKIYLVGSNSYNKNLIYVSLGDSLTAGIGVDNYEQSYPYLIAEKLSAKDNIILKDISAPGFKISDLEKTLLPMAILDKPDIITLFVGINDVRSNVSKADFEKNYEQTLKILTRETKAKIYVVNIPYVGSSSLILPPYNYYFNFKTNEFNEIIKNLSQKNNVTYVDLYSPTIKEFKKSDSYYSADLFHPSAKGYAFWANIIYDNFN
jgi:acyl-CoA thioesterase-1